MSPKKKKLVAAILSAAMVLTSASAAFAANSPTDKKAEEEKNESVTNQQAEMVVDVKNNPDGSTDVTMKSLVPKEDRTTVTINKVEVDAVGGGKTVKYVTIVGKNILNNSKGKKVKKLKLGKNVKEVKNGALNKANKLNTLEVNTLKKGKTKTTISFDKKSINGAKNLKKIKVNGKGKVVIAKNAASKKQKNNVKVVVTTNAQKKAFIKAGFKNVVVKK